MYSSPKSQAYLLQDSIGQTMNNLNQMLLRKLPIAIPPLDEQIVIAKQVNKILLMIDELEKKVDEREDLSEKFTQAVLKEAFTRE
jgi:type I restriction enzyme S subunit